MKNCLEDTLKIIAMYDGHALVHNVTQDQIEIHVDGVFQIGFQGRTINCHRILQMVDAAYKAGKEARSKELRTLIGAR